MRLHEYVAARDWDQIRDERLAKAKLARKRKQVFRKTVEMLSGYLIYSSATLSGDVYRLSLYTGIGRREGLTKGEITRVQHAVAKLQGLLPENYPAAIVDWHLGCAAYLNVRIPNEAFVEKSSMYDVR